MVPCAHNFAMGSEFDAYPANLQSERGSIDTGDATINVALSVVLHK